MSDAAVATKAAKSVAAPAAPNAKPTQTLREVKPKSFAPSALQPLGYGDVEVLTVTVPKEWTFADVLKPVAWTSVANRVAKNPLGTTSDKIGSLILVDTADNSYMGWLRINGVVRDHMGNPCGLDVMCLGPSVDLKSGEPQPINLKTRKAWVDPAPVPAKED
jgi:hypothetical protein